MKNLIVKTNTVPGRIFYIEVLRIIACFAVILLHSTCSLIAFPEIYGTTTWNFVNFINAITRFAVPIFLMISGFLSFNSNKHCSFTDFLKRKTVRLIVPLFIYSFIYYVYSYSNNGFSIYDFLINFISMDVYYHLWFVFTLFTLELLVPFLIKSIQSLNSKMLLFFLFIIVFPTSISPFINKFLGVNFFGFEPLILGYFGFFLLGYILGKIDFSKTSRIIIYLNGILWIFIAYFGNKFLSSKESIDVFFNYGYQLNSYFIATAIFVFAKYNFKELKNKFINALVLNISKLTFDIYLLHVLVLELLQKIPNSGHIVILVSLSIPTFLISLLLAFIINKIKDYINKIIKKG